LGLVHVATGELERARAGLQEVLAQLEAEGYGGDSPEQEVWWAAAQIWQASGNSPQSRATLARAHRLVEEQAGRIGDPALRRSFLERVPVNREIEEAWKMGDWSQRLED
jgi:hypothetical protein